VPIYTLQAPAKINLCLHIVGRRLDGYHEMESLVAFSDIGDTITLELASTTSLDIHGPFAQGLSTTDNLVLKAHRFIEHAVGYGLPTRITIEKNLPWPAGIGGGSSDAATVIQGLLTLYDVVVQQDVVYDIACRLGSDVPVCLGRTPTWMMGVGEKLSAPVTIQSYQLVLANLNIPVPTKKVFEAYTKTLSFTPSLGVVPLTITKDFLCMTHNDLTTACCALYPSIGGLIHTMSLQHGCHMARLSGSGGTVFGLFDTMDHAKDAQAMIQDRWPSSWVRVGEIIP
jgi:4-diphosphocytidyl-2-C-methyl-D-erythritol kinase